MNKSRCFICSIIPNKFIPTVKASQAANNFCSALIEGNCFDTTVSIIPPAWSNKDIPKQENHIKYLQSHSKYKIIQNLMLIINNIKAARLVRKKKDIWFYNITKSNILCFIILRYILHINTYVILLDLTPSKKIFSINKWVPTLLKHSQGVISLSSRIPSSNKNTQYIAGVVPDKNINQSTTQIKKPLSFLFSGVLDNHTGIDLAINVFKKNPNLHLIISGLGDISKFHIENCKNIDYKGYLSYNDYLKIYDEVDVCLSLRNPHYQENSYNFPSKILEYFCHGKIVLSTIKYPEINEFSYITCNYNEYELEKVIKKIAEMDESELNIYSNNKNNLLSFFSTQYWANTFNLIESKSYNSKK